LDLEGKISTKKSGLEVLSYKLSPILSSPLLPLTTLFGMARFDESRRERGGTIALQRPDQYINILFWICLKRQAPWKWRENCFRSYNQVKVYFRLTD